MKNIVLGFTVIVRMIQKVFGKLKTDRILAELKELEQGEAMASTDMLPALLEHSMAFKMVSIEALEAFLEYRKRMKARRAAR